MNVWVLKFLLNIKECKLKLFEKLIIGICISCFIKLEKNIRYFYFFTYKYIVYFN